MMDSRNRRLRSNELSSDCVSAVVALLKNMLHLESRFTSETENCDLSVERGAQSVFVIGWLNCFKRSLFNR